jgi:hypothetical protein
MSRYRSLECSADTDRCRASGNVETLWARLPFLDTYRTMCVAPERQFRRVLEEIREMRFAA